MAKVVHLLGKTCDCQRAIVVTRCKGHTRTPKMLDHRARSRVYRPPRALFDPLAHRSGRAPLGLCYGPAQPRRISTNAETRQALVARRYDLRGRFIPAALRCRSAPALRVGGGIREPPVTVWECIRRNESVLSGWTGVMKRAQRKRKGSSKED